MTGRWRRSLIGASTCSCSAHTVYSSVAQCLSNTLFAVSGVAQAVATLLWQLHSSMCTLRTNSHKSIKMFHSWLLICIHLNRCGNRLQILMANNYSDSSDENDLYPYNTNVKSLQGYNYEPRKKGNITVGPTQNKGVSRNECNERTGKKSERLGTVLWCKCSQCIVLRPPNTEKDCICCFDKKIAIYKPQI